MITHLVKPLWVALSLSILACTTTQAQNRNSFEAYRKQKQDEFNNYAAEKRKAFEEYRKQKTKEFAKYIEQGWEKMDIKEARPVPPQPKPVKPVVKTRPQVVPDKDMAPIDTPQPNNEPKKNTQPNNKPKEEPQPAPQPKPTPKKEPEFDQIYVIPNDPIRIPLDSVKQLPKLTDDTPLEIPPLPKEDVDARNQVNLNFFGTPVRITQTRNMKLNLGGVSEKDLAQAINKLAGDQYAPLVAECAQISRELQLNGWGNFKLCEMIAKQTFSNDNEAVVLQTYLMNQLGYDVRMGCCGGERLVALCTTEMELARYFYFLIDNKKYYLIDDKYNFEPLTSYRQNMKDATRSIGFERPTQMELLYEPAEEHTFSSHFAPEVAVNLSVNKNLIDYYATMPYFIDLPWGFYARQEMEKEVADRLLPTLKKSIEGKTEPQAVNWLLHFAQNAFAYATDEEQFGYEKPFFMEENFYYPKNDCEDRAILFSYLVRKLVGLDAVLIYAPGHLWAAVEFNQEVQGTQYLVGEKRYLSCDPTYIGSDIGDVQPKFKGAQVRVVPVK